MYVGISSDASYNVLEYSFDDSFIQEAKETVAENYNIDKNNQKIIYLGGIDYAINIKGCKLHASVTLHEGTHNGTDIVKEIDKDRPCHLILHNHNNYGNHSVLAVGYQKYTYKGFFRSKDQIYIRIADGWDKRPGRYVWGGCKGCWNYVSINMW